MLSTWARQLFYMSDNHTLIWNARGLNSCARRNVMRDIVEQQRASIVCLQETKLQHLSVIMNTELTGFDYDFVFLPAIGAAGEASVAWRRDLWRAENVGIRRFSITVRLSPIGASGAPWRLTNVYGPTDHADKSEFLAELRDVRTMFQEAWALCGDFNMVYRAADKNNGRLHPGLMRRFRGLLDDLHLDELHLSGRLFTWSNRRDTPTLERLDRVFATVEWLEQYPCHHLRCLSSDSSDHTPPLLVLNTEPWGRPRFRFDDYWTKVTGFQEVTQVSWHRRVAGHSPCKILDQKLQSLSRALTSWRATRIGSLRLCLAAARAAIYEFDKAEEFHALSVAEQQLCRELQHAVLGLASLHRTMARQRARTRQLGEGDACTRYFHLQACHRRRKNYLFTIVHDGQTFSEEEAKAELVFNYYHSLLGTGSHVPTESTSPGYHCRNWIYPASPHGSRQRRSPLHYRPRPPTEPRGLMGSGLVSTEARGTRCVLTS